MEFKNIEDFEARIEELRLQIKQKEAEITANYPDKPEKVSLEELHEWILQAQQPYYMCEINAECPRVGVTDLEIDTAVQEVIKNFNKLLERELSELTYNQMNHFLEIIRFGIGRKKYSDVEFLLKELSFSKIITLYEEKNEFIAEVFDYMYEVEQLPKEYDYNYELFGTIFVLETYFNLLKEVESKCSPDEIIVISRKLRGYYLIF